MSSKRNRLISLTVSQPKNPLRWSHPSYRLFKFPQETSLILIQILQRKKARRG